MYVTMYVTMYVYEHFTQLEHCSFIRSIIVPPKGLKLVLIIGSGCVTCYTKGKSPLNVVI